MDNVTVDLDKPSLYAEKDTKLHRIKRKMTYKNIFKLLNYFVPSSGEFSILEIGTGSGYFLTTLENTFPKATIYGLEYDPRLVSLSTEKIKEAVVLQGNAENFDLEYKNFDFIVSFQVIEHLYQPDKMIESVKKHLSDEGIFILTTPNLGSLASLVLKDKWHGFRDDHVSLKDSMGWKLFLEENGFECLKMQTTFFTGFPIFNKLPFGIINWCLLYFYGSISWKYGESVVGVFKQIKVNEAK